MSASCCPSSVLQGPSFHSGASRKCNPGRELLKRPALLPQARRARARYQHHLSLKSPCGKSCKTSSPMAAARWPRFDETLSSVTKSQQRRTPDDIAHKEDYPLHILCRSTCILEICPAAYVRRSLRQFLFCTHQIRHKVLFYQ